MKKAYPLLLILFGLYQISNAQSGNGDTTYMVPKAVEIFYNDLKNENVQIDSSFFVIDDKLNTPEWYNIDTIYKVLNKVTLSFIQDSLWIPDSVIVVTAIIKILSLDSALTPYINIDTLQIIYMSHPDSLTIFKNQFIFKDRHFMDIEILDLTVDGDTGEVQNFISMSLAGESEIDRDENLFCYELTSAEAYHLYDSDELLIYWNSLSGVTHYDLEWTFYDDSSYVIKNWPSTFNSDIYKNNSTRITVSALSYKLSLVYPNGKLIYRVRGVKIDSYGNRLTTAWSSDVNNIFTIQWHEPDFNWQYTSVFAEEGKKKEVVNYFDGSLRNRQNVTRSNSDRNAIIEEKVYDHQGRPAVSFLPVPHFHEDQALFEDRLRYYHKFNLTSTTSNKPFDREDFDMLTGCADVPSAVADSDGAGLYYSSNNPLTSDYNKFIPESEGYPYTITQYTPDLTGRVSKTGNVGPELTFGSGHETQYFYGKPGQEELDRLFGTDVGYASHYTKEMVLDPNNQVSVTYKDAKGRVIATALAGSTPPNLQALTGINNADTLSKDLLDDNNINFPNIIASYPFLAEQPGTYFFEYSLVPPVVEILNCDSNTICYDCYYDVKIIITNNCTQGEVMNRVVKSFNLNDDFDWAFSCNLPQNILDTFSLYLPDIGSYNITKVVTLRDDGDPYHRYIFALNNSCKEFNEFLAEAEASIDFTGCNVTCESCYESLGTENDFINNYIAKLTNLGVDADSIDILHAQMLYGNLTKKCEELCNTPDLCEQYLFKMLDDLSPGGQYANDSSNDNGSMLDQTSILYNKPYNYRSFNTYVDEFGQPSFVLHNDTLLPPQYLPAQVFIDNFQTSWAITLLPLHPEYCYYMFCIDNSASHAYDFKMLEADTWQEAIDSGYFELVNDPFFASGSPGNVHSVPMSNYINNPLPNPVEIMQGCTLTLTLYQLAMLTIIDTLQLTSCALDTTQICISDKNYIWRNWRAQYLAKKNDFYQTAQNTHVTANNCSNICIGGGLSPYDTFGHDCTGSQACQRYCPKKPVFINSMTSANIQTATFSDSLSAVTYFDQNFYAECAEQCELFVKNWMSTIYLNCGTVTDSTGLATVLAGICNTGCSESFMGSSTLCDTLFEYVTGSGTYYFSTFGQALHHFNIDSTDLNCGIYVHEFPKPCEGTLYLGNTGVYATEQIDECICDNVVEKSNEWFILYPDSSLQSFYNNFLVSNHNINTKTFTYESFLELYAKCDNDMPCNFFSVPFILPEIFECKDCITCEGILTAYNQLTQLIPSLNALSPNYDKIVTNYMNNKFNFNLLFADYEDFLTKCSNAYPGTSYSNDTINCSDLQYYIDIFLNDSTLNGYYPLTLWLNTTFNTLNTTSYYMSLAANCSINTGSHTTFFPDTINCDLIQQAWTNFGLTPGMHLVTNILDSAMNFFQLNYWPSMTTTQIKDTCRTLFTNPFNCDYPCWGIWPQFNNNGAIPLASVDLLAALLYVTWSPNYTIDDLIELITGCIGDSIVDFCIDTNAYSCAFIENHFIDYTTTSMILPFVDYFNAQITPNTVTQTQLHEWMIFCGIIPEFKLCNKPYMQILAAPDSVKCIDELLVLAHANATIAYESYLDSIAGFYDEIYYSTCMQPQEIFVQKAPVNEYYYTLYYYDQSDNLVRTVPPHGVNVYHSSNLPLVEYARSTGTLEILPPHTFKTNYNYNTLNKITKQETPDAGLTLFWYDRVGRLIVSQNAEQAERYQYSYTIYDALDRIVETGKITHETPMDDDIARDINPSYKYEQWLNDAYIKEEVVSTYYDESIYASVFPGGFTQRNLRNRVTSVTYEDVFDGDTATYNNAIHYTYDITGNVATLLHENSELVVLGKQFKRTDYVYDLISGNVHFVYYQKDSVDRFFHKYEYDADNRLIRAFTSPDGGQHWDNDGFYQYYKHGPLARLELGQDRVQGLDYAYSLQGWLKGINSTEVNPDRDMGGDGKINYPVARDAYGYTLGYFEGDYTPIGSTNNWEASLAGSSLNSNAPNLYNGNIRLATYAQEKFDYIHYGYAYEYDQLNRLKSMLAHHDLDVIDYEWKNTGHTDDHKTSYEYDLGGNLLTLERNGTTLSGNNLEMDSLTYNYYLGTNKLEYVEDVHPSGNYTVDIDNQTSNNYIYDQIGNLVEDNAENLQISWFNNGKIKEIYNTGTGSTIRFRYDPMGNRISKEYEGDDRIVTYYSRDAQGNVMAIYEWKNSDTLRTKEFDIYGSDRLGIMADERVLYSDQTGIVPPPDPDVRVKRIVGKKRYELKNHLGNVMAVITDRKLGGIIGTDVYWFPDIKTVQDFYPFGMIQPERTWESDKYRYGFNSFEKDDEVKGVGNHISFGDYGYDTRLGRRWQIDPAFNEYPAISAFSAYGNNPIIYIDPDGKRLYFVAGAGNDPGGKWKYPQRFKKIWENKGIANFRILDATHGSKGDMLFTEMFRNNPTTLVPRVGIYKATDFEMIKKTADKIVNDLMCQPLQNGEQLNLAGYSYGAVLQAYVALELVERGVKIDNLILIGSPTPDDSPLYKSLMKAKQEGLIGNVIRDDIKGDLFSNPSNDLIYMGGTIQNSFDSGKHFDLARPGEKADKRIGESADKAINEGVK
jgi:hypothetical protein